MATLFEMEPLGESGLKLNDAQRRAITHGEGPLLVIAGAGTGKTRVITERIRHLLLSDASLPGESILGLTFTDKAAGEMKARVVKTVGERAKDVTLKTFHAFCDGLLKDTDPQRRMLDKFDHWILLRRNLSRLQLDRYRRLAEPGQFLNDFVEFFSRCQDELVSCDDYQRYVGQLAAQLQAERAELDADTLAEREEAVAREQEISRAYRASEDLLREKKCSSFGTLITGAVGLLEGDAALRASLQNRFRYILVDEFQDTNIAQLRLLQLLVNDSKNIFAVGDNDQAIYRFRGASFGSFKLFLERFAGWREGLDSTRFRVSLTENYRSTPNILRVATQVIGQNTVSADFPKKILSPNKPEGEKIRIVELPAPEDEARWVAGELERIHKAGRRWRDFAAFHPRASSGQRCARVSALDCDSLRRHCHCPRVGRAGLATCASRPGTICGARPQRTLANLRCTAIATTAAALRSIPQRVDRASEIHHRATQNHEAPRRPPHCRRSVRMARSLPTRFGPGSRLRQAPGRIYRTMGRQERYPQVAGVHRVSGFFRASGRHYLPGRRCSRRCRALDDRARRERPGVFSRVRVAGEQKQIPAARAPARLRVPCRVDEGRRARRTISQSRGTPPVLCGLD